MMMSILFPALMVIASQTEPSSVYPNVKIKVDSEKKQVSLDSLRNFKINYTICNLSKDALNIDSLDIPNYEDNDYDKIGFKIFYKHSTRGWQLYPFDYGDISEHIDLEKSSGFNLVTDECFSYSFNLFRFYILNDKGNYRIYGTYRSKLKNQQGYYYQQSKDFIEIVVE